MAFTSGGVEGGRVPLLLPALAVAALPIARRFRARLLVEAHPAHEPDLTEAPSLFAIAIARELGAG